MLNVLECKHCHAPLPKDDFTQDQEVVICDYCDTVHYRNPAPVDFPDKPKRRKKQKRKKPDKFTLKDLPDGVEIDYPWFGKQHRGLLFFAVIWNAFIIFFTVIAVTGGFEAGFDPTIFCFMSPFYAVGIGMAYYVVAGLLNTTQIKITPKGIATFHSPVPMMGTRNHNATKDDIAQVYCRRRVAYTSNDVPVHVFDLHYIKRGGEDIELIKGLGTLHEAHYIEQQIERLYRINDADVDGEYESRF